MKKVGLSLLVVLLLGGAYLLGTVNAKKVISLPEAQWTQGSEAAEAWRGFTTSLEAAGPRVFAATASPAERLEGLQFLTQLASASLEMKLAKGSVVRPRFTDWMSDYRKFLGDSPDAVYHTAEISPAYRYEIRGSRNDAHYLGFMLYGRQLNGWNRAVANLASDSLRFDAQGNFRIVLSAEQPADDVDWLPMEDDVHMVMVRQYFHGRDGMIESEFSIRNLDDPVQAPPGEAEVAAGLRAASRFFNDTVDGAIALTEMLAGSPNTTDVPAQYSADFGGIFYPTFDNEYFGGWFYLEDDEALVIEGEVPSAQYWSVSLQNRWMQSIDAERHQVALNDKQIETENGRYRIVLSAQRPAQGNWLDTAGYREGMVAIRYQMSQNSPRPVITRVDMSSLAGVSGKPQGEQ